MYENALMAAGFDEKQARVYIACLEAGPSKVPEIARQADIKRTTAYGIIDELVSMGLLAASYKGKTKLFKAQDPKIIISLLEERKKKYDDVLECTSKQVKQIVRVRQHNEAVGDAFIKEFIRKRIARGIVTHNLHPKFGDLYSKERGMEDPKLKRYVRYLPPNVFYAAIIMIYDHKVAMVSTKEENFGFIIESKEFSNTLSAYFDFMWVLGSKEPDLG